MREKLERHVPVLFEEAIDFLAVRKDGTYVDCTAGAAGHAEGIVRRLGRRGRLIGFDRDPEALAQAEARLRHAVEEMGSEAPAITLIGEPFSRIEQHVEAGTVDGLLADFGVSSMQLDEAQRGFSFQADGPLDMRMDTRSGQTAAQVVNMASERELADLVYEYGSERRSRRIARAVVRGRPIETTGQLARIVQSAVRTTKHERIHPATRTFQALRIYVNSELEEIEALLRAAPGLVKAGGRLAAISFHSLEDRLVKDALRDGASRGEWRVLTRKPVTAGDGEMERNPRSRSAKLRAAERLAQGQGRTNAAAGRAC